jgi:hypothetical protein
MENKRELVVGVDVAKVVKSVSLTSTIPFTGECQCDTTQQKAWIISCELLWPKKRILKQQRPLL